MAVSCSLNSAVPNEIQLRQHLQLASIGHCRLVLSLPKGQCHTAACPVLAASGFGKPGKVQDSSLVLGLSTTLPLRAPITTSKQQQLKHQLLLVLSLSVTQPLRAPTRLQQQLKQQQQHQHQLLLLQLLLVLLL